MKILSVTTSIPGDDAAWWRMFNIANILRDNGHEVHFIHYCSKPNYDRIIDKGQYPYNTFILANEWNVFRYHVRVLSQEKYDLVYGNTHTGTFCSLPGKLKNIPLIFDMHGGLVEEFQLNNSDVRGFYYIFQYIEDVVIDYLDKKCSDRILCVSRKMLQYLNEKGIPASRLAYVTNGVDLEYFNAKDEGDNHAFRSRLGLDDKFIIGYVGGFQKWQGVENFILAAKSIRDERAAFLVVGGDREYRDGNVVFMPSTSREQVKAYYSACDVLTLPRPDHPSTEIAAPTKFAEYTAMGKPILTTNVGDAAELVKKYGCGMVVNDNSPEQLARGFEAYHGFSADKMLEMGRKSRALAENEFSWNDVYRNLLKVIESIG
ncbi:MAG TPA: glycosyltransferase family 4 protein [Methanocella sp.]|uniref:glycosyltransferase family 4 protein n=1 Tax=Methanocella sp. TaxID=2052833 RepID=UPI002C08B9A5|nr:glycosyltransferase family 4 protein [Methanocella sp.]HTY90210.1 glycosyltransferase family 4 protein [Methanocella sp.]